MMKTYEITNMLKIRPICKLCHPFYLNALFSFLGGGVVYLGMEIRFDVGM